MRCRANPFAGAVTWEPITGLIQRGALLAVAAIETRAECIAARGPWSVVRAPCPKGPGARFRLRNGGFLPFIRDSGPRGGVAAAPALFRTNNHRKNDMA